MSSDGENAKNQTSEVDEKQNLDSTDSSQDSQDANKSETEDSQDKDAGGDVKPKEKSPEPVKTEEKSDVNDNSKEEKDADTDNEKDDIKKPKEEKIKDDKSEEKTDDDTEGGDASEDGDDDDKKEVPLLDQPLEQTGPRERKKVQRFNEEFTPEAKETSKVDIPTGGGNQLGDIPRIDASISRFKNEDLKLLHRVLFKTPGKTVQIRKNIRKFNGFDFNKDSDAYQKKVSAVQKMEIKQLRSVCEMLDLDKKGSKDDLTERICEFLLEPKDSGKPSGGGRPKRTAAVRANNRGYSSPEDDYDSEGNARRSSRATRGKGKRTNLKDESSSQSDAEYNPSDSEEERPRVTKKRSSRIKPKKQETDEEPSDLEETPSSDESEVLEEPKSKRKRVVVPTPKVQNNKNKKAAPKNAKATPKKPAPASTSKNKKQETKKTRKRGKDESEEDERDSENNDASSSEDEPLVKKNKSPQPPTDEEIKTYVKEILEGANLEEITMKTVCKQVYSHYPDFDLTHKKDFIKITVKSLIST